MDDRKNNQTSEEVETDVTETGTAQGESAAGMDEKDIAAQEKIVANLEKQLQEWMENQKEGTFILTNGQFQTEMNMQKSDKGYVLKCCGKEVLSINEKKEITYNKESMREIRDMVEKQSPPLPYEKLGLPSPEYLAHLEEEKAKREAEKGDGKEKGEEEKPEEEKEADKDRDKEEIEKAPEEELAAQLREEGDKDLRTEDLVEIGGRNSQKIDKHNTAYDKIKGDYKHIYSVPCGDYVNQFKYVGVKADGTHEDIKTLNRSKGTNPSQEVIMLDKKGNDVQKGMLSEMYEVEGTNGREFFGVKKGEGGVEEHVYIRRTPGNDYVAVPIPQANTRNIEMADLEVRELMTRELNDDNQLSEVAKRYYKVEELEKQGVPDKINPVYTTKGIQLEEITTDEARARMKNGLQKEYGFSEPQAEETVKMVFDGRKDFDKAIEEVQIQEPEHAEEKYEGRTPWGDAEERRAGRR